MKIYVGNLSHSMDESGLREYFEKYGQVSSVKIIKDRYTGSPRGFAFVEMPDDGEAKQAIESLNNQDIAGRTVNVNEARPQEPRTGGGGGGGRFGGNGGGGGSGYGGSNGSRSGGSNGPRRFNSGSDRGGSGWGSRS